MKVLMINTVSGYSSTGSICEGIAYVLEKQGHECYIAYGQKTTNYAKSYKVGTVLENHLHNIGSRVFGKQGYYTKQGTKKLVEFINIYNPDIIHLHNLHGHYLNLNILFGFLENFKGKIFWTFHDCWPYTGKCAHYTSVECYKWQTHCEKCPQVKSYPPSIFFDRSFEMFEDKKQWFLSIKDIQIITVSDWLKKEVEKSFFRNNTIKRIYNWVDHDVFRIYENFELLKSYDLNAKAFNIICVSASWSDGSTKFKDLLYLANKLQDNIEILLVGKVLDGIKLPKNIKHIPYIDKKEKLAQLYSFADVYVHLSSEDTFGKVIAESLSCGTPAIVYNSTACPEVVDHKTGVVVENRNIEQIAEQIIKIKSGKLSFNSEDCRRRVLDNFDINSIIQETIDFYNK